MGIPLQRLVECEDAIVALIRKEFSELSATDIYFVLGHLQTQYVTTFDSIQYPREN